MQNLKAAFIVTLIITLFLISLSTGYYFFYFLPQLEKNKLHIEQQKIEQLNHEKEQAKTEKQITQQNKDKCLEQAHNIFIKEGKIECNSRGYSDEQINNLKCILPQDVLTRLENKQKDAQSFCLELYK